MQSAEKGLEIRIQEGRQLYPSSCNRHPQLRILGCSCMEISVVAATYYYSAVEGYKHSARCTIFFPYELLTKNVQICYNTE